MDSTVEKLEAQLDSFDLSRRTKALQELAELQKSDKVNFEKAGKFTNLHCHTFYSYNSYGYSPSKFAWLAKKSGLAVGGIVDFDVLDGLDEFLSAAQALNLKYCVGMETRVFVPEFADKVINSPGEPGIAYHMGVGFTRKPEGKDADFLLSLKNTAQSRNQELIKRVNEFLKPVELDYEKDVVCLTPAGNPTERHISLAYARKAKEVFANEAELTSFWSEKLGIDASSLDLPEGGETLNTIRAKTMKRGGVGYVQPDAGSFAKMADFNSFVLTSGGVPTLTWLNGLSDGEKEIEKLVKVSMQSGVEAINIIPDRNFTPGVKDDKLANLYAIAELAEKLDLPLIAGTEMNSPGQKFVDAFETAELSPLTDAFLKGAYIMYGHSILGQKLGVGYTGKWAAENFGSRAEKNDFFETIGKEVEPERTGVLDGLNCESKADEIINRIKG